MLGEKGNLSDLVLNAVRQHADSLRISLTRETVELQIGEPLTIEGTLRSSLTSHSGPIKIVLKDKVGQKLTETTTDSRGQFLLQLPEGLSTAGDSTLIIFPEVNAFEELESQELDSAYEELAVKVNMVPAGLLCRGLSKVHRGAPDMAQAWAVVSLEYNGRSIYSYESDAVKDGGINPAQAHSRVLSKLLKNLESEEVLFSNIKKALEEI
ncbi:MAG: hypothetical protein U5P10_15330 [Spirochaetia bacterium]|nr:hypothetical protein [Spirochaetia bacterium]